MTAPDRAPDGTLLVGQGPAGDAYHVTTGGHAACSWLVPIAAAVPIGQVTARRWCRRYGCRRHLQGQVPPAAVDGTEHVCPACYVERAAAAWPCPNCASTWVAVPAAAVL